MNDTLELLLSHQSDRSFLDKAIPDDVLDNVIRAAWRAPTSVHSQQVSIIVTRDKETKQQLAALTGGQPWVAQAPVFLTFVLDMHKSRIGIEAVGKQQLAHTSVESIVSGSQDVGIALASAMLAARSQGLGVVPIGGIRNNPQQVIKLLNLPDLTFPINGLTLGYVDKPAHLKPRMPINAFRHEERYQDGELDALIATHNRELSEHWQRIDRGEGENWSQTVAGYYDHVYYPDVLPGLLHQGFNVDK
ncbi:TPA: NADPH-dependent oxidoreductase [Kluyvera cryocrescens]|nr:NADPH-dependent oxidoreductase [Kluyvera cryocrescens]